MLLFIGSALLLFAAGGLYFYRRRVSPAQSPAAPEAPPTLPPQAAGSASAPSNLAPAAPLPDELPAPTDAPAPGDPMAADAPPAAALATLPAPRPVQAVRGLYTGERCAATALGGSLIIKPTIAQESRVASPAKLSPEKTHPYERAYMRQTFTLIDVATANMYPDSICQLTLLLIEQGTITDRRTFLIRPPYDTFSHTASHGITRQQTESAPSFAELWPTLQPCIEGQLLAAYDAPFIIGCLFACLENFELPVPDTQFFDIRETALAHCRLAPDAPLPLAEAARRFGLSPCADDTLARAQAAADIQRAARQAGYYDNTLHTATVNAHSIYMRAIRMEEAITSTRLEDHADVLRGYGLAVKNGEDLAKVLKQAGEVYEKCGHIQQAITYYSAALARNPRVGVKQRISRLRAALKGPDNPALNGAAAALEPPDSP